jgi:hypothetical protein
MGKAVTTEGCEIRLQDSVMRLLVMVTMLKMNDVYNPASA